MKKQGAAGSRREEQGIAGRSPVKQPSDRSDLSDRSDSFDSSDQSDPTDKKMLQEEECLRI